MQLVDNCHLVIASCLSELLPEAAVAALQTMAAHWGLPTNGGGSLGASLFCYYALRS